MNRRNLFGVLAAGALSLGLGANALAEDDQVAAAGNGGVATAEANGGVVAFDADYVVSTVYSDVNGVQILEWTVVDASGGTAIADASGGDDNEAENED